MSGRRRTGDVAAPLIGSGINGVLAYVVFALTTRTLGSADASPVSVLWSYWTLSGAALTFPIQHWVTRTVTAHGEGAIRRALPRTALAVLGLALLATGLSWLVRGSLFAHAGPWWPALIGLVTVGSALVGLARGGLSARERFTALMGSLALENLVRAVGIALLAVAGVHDALWYGVCLVVGHLVAFCWPSALRFGDDDRAGRAPAAWRFLTGAAGGQLMGQVVLTGGPVVLALAGGAQAAITALFAALALFRAPYVLALGAVAPLTGWLTAHVVAGRARALNRFRAGLVAVTVVGAVLAAGFGAWLGPLLLHLVFGGDVDLARTTCAVVAAGSLVAVSNLVAVIGVIAQDRTRVLVTVWPAACVVAALVLILPGVAELDRVVWAFVAAELVAFVGLSSISPRSTEPVDH